MGVIARCGPPDPDRARSADPARDQREGVIAGSGRDLSAPLPSPQSLRQGQAAPQPGAGAVSRSVPRQGHLYHQHRRQRGGGKEHHGPYPSGTAGALAGAPQGGAGHHRRLPVSQQGAGSPWPDASQGIPRVL